MELQDIIISFETAKMLNEIGYDVELSTKYHA